MMAPALAADGRVKLVAAADPRPEARRRFEEEFGGRALDSVAALCASDIDVLYIATPHQFHAEHARIACRHRRHVLVEKPMALTVEECRGMIDAAKQAGVHLIVGHSHSFDLPILHTRKIIESGKYGAVKMITALNFTDFLYRPRRPEELDTARGGGIVYNQAAHHVDMARLLSGAPVTSVRAMTGTWDARRPTEGAYSCLLGFANGSFAGLTYSGYAHFDSDELTGWIGESGQVKDPNTYGATRKALHGDELALKASRNYGGKDHAPTRPQLHQHFGFLVVSCERADLKPLADGVMIYADDERRFEPLPRPTVHRAEVMDELYAAAAEGRAPLHDGAWGMATLQACLAILESARTGREIVL
jgi:phthalate 4,5-cis-dihydrodiol dehydrogenase